MHRAALALAALAAGCGGPSGGRGPTWRAVVSEDFTTPIALQSFVFSDPEAWRWNADDEIGSLELIDGPERYAPPYRSPHHIALIKDIAFGEFRMELDARSTIADYPHRDLVVVFGYQSPARFHYVHLAPRPDEHAHNVFRVADADRTALLPVQPTGFDWGETWHRLRVERRADTLRVSADGVLLLEAALGPEIRGQIGIGSFDDAGRFARLRVHAAGATPL